MTVKRVLQFALLGAIAAGVGCIGAGDDNGGDVGSSSAELESPRTGFLGAAPAVSADSVTDTIAALSISGSESGSTTKATFDADSLARSRARAGEQGR